MSRNATFAALLAVALLGAAGAWIARSGGDDTDVVLPTVQAAPEITPWVAPPSTAPDGAAAAQSAAPVTGDAVAEPAFERPPVDVRVLPVDQTAQAAAARDARDQLPPDQARELASREFRIGIQTAMSDARPALMACWEEAVAQGRTDDERLVFDLRASRENGRGGVSLTSIDSQTLQAEDLDCFADVMSRMEIPPPDPIISDAGGSVAIRYPVVFSNAE